MELRDNVLVIDRELSKLDNIVLNFTQKLGEIGVDYVIVSGYVAILAGRSRGTEDIDIIIEGVNRKRLEEIVKDLTNAGYWCLNAEISEIFEMLKEGLAVRFAEKEKAIPNFELSFPTDQFEKAALKKRLKAKMDSKSFQISPLELQIAYKLYLGTEKDYEDALHLYHLFKDDISKKELESYAEALKVGEDLDELRRT